MKKHTITTFCFLLLIGLTSCKKDRCLNGDEYPKGTHRELAPFSAINVNLSAIVELIQDTASNVPFVELITEENVQSYLATSVVNETLNITLNQCFSNHYEIKIKVHYDSLNIITTSGPGDIISKTLIKQDKLTLNIESSGKINLTTDVKNLTSNINGTGSIIINGQINHHLINHFNSGSINTYQAITNTVEANMNGTGSHYLRIKKHITANIFNSGNIYYKGNPTIKENNTGSGLLINDN